MQELRTVLESRTKVRFQDCDPFNHLNNLSHLDSINPSSPKKHHALKSPSKPLDH